ncbi:Putative paraquat-inducible protein B [Neorhizobium galegae bv. orientalis]|nr:Putative paraquat-inducible protein B [Neorhizobium galegae bv. orientalis]
MPNQLSIMLDKSVLQSLSPREARWLFHHFLVVIPPVLFSEVLGDIRKADEKSNSGSGKGDAMSLARKIEGSSIALQASSYDVLRMELSGRPFRLDGRPVVDAEKVQMPDGSFGAYIDQTPMQAVLERWQAGDFDRMEQIFARAWRDHLAEIDLEGLFRAMGSHRQSSITTAADVSRFVKGGLFQPNANFSNLRNWLQVTPVPKSARKTVLERWKRAGRPNAVRFAPYTAYLARLTYFFHLAVGHGVVTTRKSNKIDFQYLEYLPFARVFSSSDNLHADLFPHFAWPFNIYVKGSEMKAALREMADFYDAMSDKDKEHGSFAYANFPPAHMNNAVTQAYDKVIPDWRVGANEPRPPISPEENARIMEHLRPMMDAMRKHTGQRRS